MLNNTRKKISIFTERCTRKKQHKKAQERYSVSINSHVNLQKDHELDSVTDFNVVGEQIETNYSDYQEINKSIFDALADINKLTMQTKCHNHSII